MSCQRLVSGSNRAQNDPRPFLFLLLLLPLPLSYGTTTHLPTYLTSDGPAQGSAFTFGAIVLTINLSSHKLRRLKAQMDDDADAPVSDNRLDIS